MSAAPRREGAGDDARGTAGGPSGARKAVFAGVAFALSLFLIESATRILLPTPWIVPRRPAEDPFLVPHPERGYAFRRSFTNEWRSADYAVEVRLNELGLRDGPLAEARAGGLRVLALGDSYTFGIGVEADETWPGVLEQRLEADLPDRHPTVFDAGIPAYSARQIRQLGEELLPQLEPQIVILGLYTNSAWRVENPYVIFGQTLITTDRVGAMAIGRSNQLLITAFPPGPLRSLDLWLKQHLYVAAHLLALVHQGRHWPERPAPDESPAGVARAWAPVLAEIDRLDASVRAAGARLVVLPVNAQESDGSFSPHQARDNALLRDHCLARSIELVDPLPALIAEAKGRPIHRFPSDGHWTATAHALAAGLLERTILDRVLPTLGAATTAQIAGGSGPEPPAGAK
ncbi:MAG: GDSL-type esterase/lipase family protein [Myxococcota bacterium]